MRTSLPPADGELHSLLVDTDALRTVVAHQTVAPAGWPGWIALSERLPADGSDDHGERAPDTDVEATWRMFTIQTYERAILPHVATREALQNSVDAVRLLHRFMRWARIRDKDEAIRRLVADKSLGERFWTAQAVPGEVPDAKGFSGRFAVTWDEEASTLSWEDDGIGMDLATLRTAFFRIPATRKGALGGGSEQTAGGFGVAKAVILGCGVGGFEIHTRNVLATGWHTTEQGTRVYRTSSAPIRTGTRITIRDIIWNYEKNYETRAVEPVRVASAYRGRYNRGGSSLYSLLREVLSVSDLPGLEITLNGNRVTSAFAGRGKPHPEYSGVWQEQNDKPVVTASVKSFRRTDDNGNVYVRLNGLFQFRESGDGELDRDYVVDLDTTLTPDDPAYPLVNSRESLKFPVASYLSRMMSRIRDATKDKHPEHKDYEVFLPSRKDGEEASGGSEIERTISAAFADPAIRASMEDALGAAAATINAMYQDRDEVPLVTDDSDYSGIRGGEDESPRRRETDAPEDGAGERALPPTAPRAEFQVTAPVDYTPPPVDVTVDDHTEAIRDAARTIQMVLTSFVKNIERVEASVPYSTLRDVRRGLERVNTIVAQPESYWYRGEAELATILEAIKTCVRFSYRPGGYGTADALRLRPALDALAYIARETGIGTSFALELTRTSPFGGIGALRVKRMVGADIPEATKARRRAFVWRFRKGYAKWVPYLLAWDAVLRLLVREGQLVRRRGSARPLLEYLPPFYPGFVLDPSVHGMASIEPVENDESVNVIYINPEDFAAVVRAQRKRPIAIAGFLHTIAVHELTHMNGHMGDGHGSEFVVEREFLGSATAHLLPVIETIVVRMLGLPKPPSPEAREVARLERALAKARDERDALKRRAARGGGKEGDARSLDPAQIQALVRQFAEIYAPRTQGLPEEIAVDRTIGAILAFLDRASPAIARTVRAREATLRVAVQRELSRSV